MNKQALGGGNPMMNMMGNRPNPFANRPEPARANPTGGALEHSAFELKPNIRRGARKARVKK